MTTPTPKSIHALYTFYLSPAHVDKPATVTIDCADIRQIFNSITNKNEDCLVVHFSDARRSLKCNKTQTAALWDITGTDDYTKWTGTRITLSPAKSKSGKNTIKIEKAVQ